MNQIHRLTSEGKSPYEVARILGLRTEEAFEEMKRVEKEICNCPGCEAEREAAEAMKQAADEAIAEAEMAGWDEVERMPEDDCHAHCAKEFRDER